MPVSRITDSAELRIHVGDVTVLVDRAGGVVSDSLTLADWRPCSTGVGQVPSWAPGTEPISVPQGEIHAFRTDDDSTACGRPLDSLHRWDDRPFSDGLLNRCRACLDRIAGGPSDASS